MHRKPWLLRDRRDDRPQLSLYTLDNLVLEASVTAEQNRAILRAVHTTRRYARISHYPFKPLAHVK